MSSLRGSPGRGERASVTGDGWADSVLYLLVKSLLLIPAVLLLPLMAGLALLRRRGDPAWRLCIACAVLLYAVSTPLAADLLLDSLQQAPLSARQAAESGAQAIVVLSAESSVGPEYGDSTVGPMTLTRVRYGAWLHRLTGLPVLVTGGPGAAGQRSMAEAMRQALVEDFAVTEVWVEDRAETTAENAAFSAVLLRAHGVDRVLLVTSAWHMPRSLRAFERHNITAIAAPTNFDGPGERSVLSLIPSARALQRSYYGLHEWIGGLVYRLT